MSAEMTVVALIGRPNVGKSTLFNRLTKSRAALVADMPGLTRDRHYKIANLARRRYMLVDTGGFEPLIDGGVMYQMACQTEQAMAEADAVVFLVDGKSGITAQDKLIANKLRRLDKPVYVAVNKVEGVDQATAVSDFYALGLTNLLPISASHGEGVTDLIHRVLANFPLAKDVDPDAAKEDEGIRFAVIGRPNVGKSTLVNALLGEERVIVFDEAGTTRDSIEISFERSGCNYTIIDTAGIRRKGRVVDKIEKFSILKALQSIESSNIVVLVLDATVEIAEQDATIAGYALDSGKAVIIVVNKWDMASEQSRMNFKDELKRKLYFLDYAQIVYVSALYKKGVNELFKSLELAYKSAFIKLSTPKLTRVLQEALKRQMPAYKAKFRPKMRYAHQGGMNPPIIIIHGNSLEHVSKAYTKYLERSFRKVFNLVGTPLRIEYKTTDNPYKER